MKIPDPNTPIHGGYFRDKELALNTARTLDGKGIWCEVIADGTGFCLVSRGRTVGLLAQPAHRRPNGNGNGKRNHN